MGPPCSGKSTFVRSLGETTVDFNLYDRNDMHDIVPLGAAVEIGVKADKAAGSVPVHSTEHHNQQIKSDAMKLNDRLITQKLLGTEKMLIALVFTHNISFDFFRTRLMILLRGQTHMKLLLDCCTELMKKRMLMVSFMVFVTDLLT